MSTPLPSVPHPLFRNIEFAAFAMLEARNPAALSEARSPDVVKRWERHVVHILEQGPGRYWGGFFKPDTPIDFGALLADGVRWIATSNPSPVLLINEGLEWKTGPVQTNEPCFTAEQAAKLMEKIEGVKTTHPQVYFDFMYDRECEYYALSGIYAASAPFSPFAFEGFSDGQAYVRVGTDSNAVVRFLILYGLVAPEFAQGDDLVGRYPRAVHEALLTLVEAGRKPLKVRKKKPAVKLAAIRLAQSFTGRRAYHQRPLRLRPTDVQLASLASDLERECSLDWDVTGESGEGQKSDTNTGAAQVLASRQPEWVAEREDCAATAANPERLFADVRLCPSRVSGK